MQYFKITLVRNQSKILVLILFRKDLASLEKEEAVEKEEEKKTEERKVTEALHAEAFVEQLDGDQLYKEMLNQDSVSRALLLMGEEAEEIFNR